jgi:beta-lactamase regulating signal transducer with metallopeptidase domain
MMTLDHAWNSLVTIMFQSVALCLMTGAVLFLLRKSAAATRHLVLVLSVSALLTVPFLALLLPHWQVPLYARTPAPLPPPAERTAMQAQDSAPRVRSGVHRLSQKVSAPETSASVSLTRPFPSQERPFTHAGQIPVPFASAGEVRRAQIPVWQTARCQQAILAVWGLGTTLALLRLLAGLIGTRRVTSRETKSDPILSQTVAQIQRELGIERAVIARQTVVGSELPVPLTWGHFRPTLLLPPAFLEWPRERQRMVVLHELAHIQRADWLVQVLVQITLALYWFHPLVWWTTYRLQAESERACDDTVLLTGVTPSAYAETLLEVLRTMNRSKPSAASFPSMLSMAQPPIEARLQAILSPQRRQRPPRLTMLLASAGTALCAVLLASVQVKAVQAPPTPVRSSPLPNISRVSNVSQESAFSAQPIVSIPESDASRLPPASPQSDVEKPTATSQERQEEQEIAMLRKKLDALELLLVQSQKENVELTQRLKALEAQNRGDDRDPKAGEFEAQRARAVALKATEAYRRAEESRTSPASPTAERDTPQNVLEDLERQKASLEAQVQRTEEQYRGPGLPESPGRHRFEDRNGSLQTEVPRSLDETEILLEVN